MGWRDLKDWSYDSAAVNFDKKHPPTPPTVLVPTRTLYLRPSFEVISGLIIQKQLCCDAHLAMYFDKNLCVGPSIRLIWGFNINIKHCHEWMKYPQLIITSMKYSFTWMYKNRVSKHFVIVLDFPCLSLFTVLFAYVVHFGCFVVRDLCSSGRRGNLANSRSL